MYLSNVPDIEFAVSKMSGFTSNRNCEYWKVITKNFGYLLINNNCGLHYCRFPTILGGYTDASWTSSIEYHKSAFEWIFALVEDTISWKSKKQMWITLSTIELEFEALSSAGEEVEWLRDLMLEVPLAKDNVSKVLIHCSSQATLPRAYKKCVI
ncbi:secreted RxLR effector protein 161-like [Lathyrus oleraceus]|uniref:secreted RxLR effector protein 161-like n=1 Tax=Pisum sativum TaxID=3888 RepID=UPI0021D32E26|nr:secreted RxLR effector protein 161-like [Pisum sativum]